MGRRGPVGASRATQEAKGVRPSRLRPKARERASEGLGEAPGHLSAREQARWKWLGAHFPHLKAQHALSVELLVGAEEDLRHIPDDMPKDRMALRKEVAGYQSALGCLPGRQIEEGEKKVDATESAMEAFRE